MKNKVLDLIRYGDLTLKEAGIENSKFEAEIFLGIVIRKSRLQLYIKNENIIPQEKVDVYKNMIKERSRRKPLQYILGYTDFYGLRFKVDESVLIPRPETEQLVEIALDHINDQFDKTMKILDIGTGSGNIAISIAKNSNIVELYAMDNNENALAIAKENAENNGVMNKIHFFKRSIFDDYNELKQSTNYVDVIVSNPPYIPNDKINDLMPEISKFEPRDALAAGEDGLDFIKKIIRIANGLLLYNGILIMEIGEEQKREAEKFASRYFSSEVINDMNNKPRILIAEKRN
jgi:release factor glutamine methyltransferase